MLDHSSSRSANLCQQTCSPGVRTARGPAVLAVDLIPPVYHHERRFSLFVLSGPIFSKAVNLDQKVPAFFSMLRGGCRDPRRAKLVVLLVYRVRRTANSALLSRIVGGSTHQDWYSRIWPPGVGSRSRAVRRAAIATLQQGMNNAAGHDQEVVLG